MDLSLGMKELFLYPGLKVKNAGSQHYTVLFLGLMKRI